MDMIEAMRMRHSVRQYVDEPLSAEAARALNERIARLNSEHGLHMQLVTDEPQAFASRLARYGKFSGVRNYLALVGAAGAGGARDAAELDEAMGYCGEQLVLEAQRLGLNTCWVGLTYKKIPGAVKVDAGERLRLVIALGRGVTQGVSHKSKAAARVSNVDASSPTWFTAGVEAALLAPTALNQQAFSFELLPDGRVRARAGRGFYSNVDLGIAKCHFELGSGKGPEVWA